QGKADPLLLCTTGLFCALALFLPEKYQNTILFSERWLALVLIFGLYTASAWLRESKLVLAAASALVVAACMFWTIQWRQFDTHELTGLSGSLAALPNEPRLLGLDYRRQSPWRKGSPFLQDFAYGQALRGGELNFSFVSFGPLPVEYKNPVPH